MVILDLKVGETLVKAIVDPEFKVEKEHWIEFPVEKIYLFDKKTGTSLL